MPVTNEALEETLLATRNEVYLESIAGKISQLQAAWQGLSETAELVARLDWTENMLNADAIQTGTIRIDTGSNGIGWIYGQSPALWEATDSVFIHQLDMFDSAYISGDWSTDDEDQPEIHDDRGGALDEFLEEFKPKENTKERSDEQN